MSLLFVFFFKQKTAYEMRISDWSSDVCSSDLLDGAGRNGRRDGGRPAGANGAGGGDPRRDPVPDADARPSVGDAQASAALATVRRHAVRADSLRGWASVIGQELTWPHRHLRQAQDRLDTGAAFFPLHRARSEENT